MTYEDILPEDPPLEDKSNKDAAVHPALNLYAGW
jgi:hypothetical protein